MNRKPAVALMVAGACVMALFWVCAVGCPAAFDYAEGDTAVWIWLLRHGRDLYRPLGELPLLSSNYPPLQLHLVAWLAPSDAAILPVGRLVSLAGFLLAMAMIGVSVAGATRSRRTGVLAALLFAATCQPGYHAVVCRADSLALGLGAVGVTLAARRVRGWPMLAAIAFTASLLAKHNLIVLPGGVILWALWRETRNGIVLALTTALLLGASIFALHLFEPLVMWSIAGWKLITFLRYLGEAVAPSMFGVAIAIWAWRHRDRFSPEARQVLGPWGAVLALGALWWLALGRTGSSANYLLEFFAALVVVVAVAVSAGAPVRLLYAHLALALAETTVWVIVLLAFALPASKLELSGARAALAGVSGTVFAEQAWLPALGAGKEPIAIPYLATQLSYAGRWDAAPLVRAFEHGEVARVLLDFTLEEPAANNFLHRDRFTAAELDALRAHYRLVSQSGALHVYAPR